MRRSSRDGSPVRRSRKSLGLGHICRAGPPRLLVGFALAWREEQIYPRIPALSGYRSLLQNRPMDP